MRLEPPTACMQIMYDNYQTIELYQTDVAFKFTYKYYLDIPCGVIVHHYIQWVWFLVIIRQSLVSALLVLVY